MKKEFIGYVRQEDIQYLLNAFSWSRENKNAILNIHEPNFECIWRNSGDNPGFDKCDTKVKLTLEVDIKND